MAQRAQGFEIEPATVERAKAATVLVDLGRAGSGTAFLIHPCGLFVTNRHVVEGAPSGEPVRLVVHSGEAGETVVEARVALVSEEDDLALLKTDAELAIEPLELKGAGEAGLGELSPVVVLGYPFGRRLAAEGQEFPSISINTGRVSRLEKSDARLAQIQYDAATNPGNSGGPMITPDGQVVGVVVSGFRGADVNFAIPTEQVLALVERPVIAFRPTEILFSDRHANQEFEIEILPNAPLPEVEEAILHLGAPGASRRSIPAEMEDGRFHVAAAALENGADQPPLRLRVEAKLPDATVSANVDDQPVMIGDEPVPLSGIVLVAEENGKMKTMLTRPSDGKPVTIVDGAPTGLPVLLSERHDLKLSLDGAEGLRVQSYGSAPVEIPFEIELRAAGGAVMSRAGTVRLASLPLNVTGSTRPKKPEMFSGMFGMNQRSSELDLMSILDLGEDVPGGTWEREPEYGDLETGGDEPAWLQLPARPSGNYGLVVEIVPAADTGGEFFIQLPFGERVAMLHFQGGDPGRATVQNDPTFGDGEALEFPAFEKGVPFRVQTMVRDGEISTAVYITRRSGNSTSRMPLPDMLSWSGDPADLVDPEGCPLPGGSLGIGLAGMGARVTMLEVGASHGNLLVSRELSPTIEHHPTGKPVHWNLDEPILPDLVRGRERDPQWDRFGGGFSGDISYAGKMLGTPDIGAEPSIEGEGAMRVEGDRAGFQLPSHPRLWSPTFTAAFWFRADEIVGAERRQLFDEGGEHTGAAVYLLGDTLRAGAWDDRAEGGDGEWETWLKATGIEAGRWYHVALALDAEADDPDAALQLFLDGAPADEGYAMALFKEREPGAVGTTLGSSRQCPEDPEAAGHAQFVGMIDDFSLHRQVLDANQIALLVGGRFAEEGASFPAPPGSDEEDLDIDLSGRWVDMNGGEIEIVHEGRKVRADGLNEAVKRHWTHAEGRLHGRGLRITHFMNKHRNARKVGKVSEDGQQIVFGPDNRWKRRDKAEPPEGAPEK